MRPTALRCCILSYFSCSGSFCVRLFLPRGGDLVVVREFRTSRETALGGGDRGESRGGGILRRAVVQVVFHAVDDRVGRFAFERRAALEGRSQRLELHGFVEQAHRNAPEHPAIAEEIRDAGQFDGADQHVLADLFERRTTVEDRIEHGGRSAVEHLRPDADQSRAVGEQAGVG